MDRIRSGQPVAHIAKEMGPNGVQAYRWGRWEREEDIKGSSTGSHPLTGLNATSPRKAPKAVEARPARREGPADLSDHTAEARSTSVSMGSSWPSTWSPTFNDTQNGRRTEMRLPEIATMVTAPTAPTSPIARRCRRASGASRRGTGPPRGPAR